MSNLYYFRALFVLTNKKIRLKKFILLFLAFCPVLLLSQTKRPQNMAGYDYKTLRFGFSIGMNTMDMAFKRSYANNLYPDITSPGAGINVNIVSDLRLTNNLNLRFLPGITLGERTFTFFRGDTLDSRMTLEASYLDFPLLLKYRADRLNNVRPYLIGGLNFRYDMAAKKDYNEGEQVYIRVKPADLYFEFGFGMDYYLTYFKFSTEIKLAVGLLNIIVDDPAVGYPQYIQSFDRLNSYMVMLCFHFE